MAQAPQTAMEMPQQAANPYEDPNTMAVYDQMRQSMSTKEFGDELFAGASQVDPEAMAQFREELSQIDLSPEELDSLNSMVDEVIASPDQYAVLREKYLKMGMPEELLPEQFDGQFFAALNMAIDQLVGEPAGVQAFAKGGIAELKPIAKTIASYGRNGDTMLAHITPAEARMLRRRGGSGTINPATGLPEFFLKKAFKSLGKAVKSFASSTVGKLVTTVALGFFLGPAAATALGATSTAAVAAVSGFVGSAGSTLLGGGNLSQALKAGAVGGLTAGAGAGIMGGAEAFKAGSYTGPTTISGQYNKLMGVPTADVTTNTAREAAARQAANTAAPTGPAGTTAPTDMSFMDKAKDFYDNKLFPSDIQKGALPNAQAAANAAVEAQSKILPSSITGEARSALLKNTYDSALKAAMPGILSTYAPITAAGIGAIGLAGGFESREAEASKLKPELMKDATQRIAEQGQQKQYYLQNIPGVKYDEFGAPIYGQYNPLPTAPASATPISNFDLPSTIGGIGSLYKPPSGAMGSQTPIAQPYNTASMYTNLMPPPPGYAEGGDVKPSAESAAMIDAQRAAMIAQAQALGQSGYTPTRPGSYGVERGSYTPSTGFAEFTQQYKQNNPAPVSPAPTAAPTSVPTSAPTAPPPTTGVSNPAPTAAPTTAAPSIGYTPRQLDDNFLTGSNTAPTSINYAQQQLDDNYLNRMNTVQPPIDVSPAPMDNFQTSMGGYQPPVDNFQTAMAAASPAPMDNFQTSMAAASPAPMDNFQTSMGGYQPPMESFQPMAAASPAPMESFQPMAAASPAPMDNFQTSMGGYQPPMESFQPMAAAAQPAYDYAGLSTGGGGGTLQDTYSPFGGSDFDNDGGSLQSSFNAGGIASLRSGGYPRRTGQISGPGTATSDSIPAMLSDGEFVMTAKAVRGAGKGDRRAGAKRMYALMNQLEQNASRG